MRPLIWIIDEEWAEYDLEQTMLKEKYPDCVIKFSSYDYEEDLQAFGKSADAILTQIYADISKETIKQLTCCKAIAVYGSGYDRVDIIAAKEKGIKVTNVAGYCKEDIADYVMAAVYFFYKELARLSATVTASAWGAQAIAKPPVRLSASTLHLIGLGQIGKAVAKKAIANGMKVTAYDPYVPEEVMNQYKVKKVAWAEGLSQANYISIHYALTEKTIHLIAYEDFQQMKPSAFLINTARGKIIDEAAMVQALSEELIKGVMLDVVQTEPPIYEEKIFSCKKAYITPHVSYISVQSHEELKKQAINNIMIGIEGGISPDLVNA